MPKKTPLRMPEKPPMEPARMKRRLLVVHSLSEEYYIDLDDVTEIEARELAASGDGDPIFIRREEKFLIETMIPVDLPEDRG